MTTFRVCHRTSYSYDRPVKFGLHRLMVRPRDGHDMRLLQHLDALGHINDDGTFYNGYRPDPGEVIANAIRAQREGYDAFLLRTSAMRVYGRRASRSRSRCWAWVRSRIARHSS